MAIAGRVAPIPKGAWDSTTEYSKLDIVSNNGKSFIAKKISTGQEPVTDDEFWMMIANSSAVMIGATATTNGASGSVPQPMAGDNDKCLFGDGSYKEVKSSALILDDGYVAIDYDVLS